MGRSWRFTLAMVPPHVTHNDLCVRKGRNGHHFIGKSDRLRRAEDDMCARLRRVRPDKPLGGALSVEITYCFPHDDSVEDGSPMTAKPDVDNLAKTTLDMLARERFICDDCTICVLRLVKAWSNPGCIRIAIREIGDGR